MGDDESRPTPRESGTLQRGPVFAALMWGLADVLDVWELRLGGKGPKGLRELDIQQSLLVRKLAHQARELGAEFAAWEVQDPGPEARLAALARKMDLEAQAAPYMPRF